jgi:AraC-like DNA-binding protein
MNSARNQLIKKRVVMALERSEIYRVFKRAFAKLTGLRVSITAGDDPQPAPRDVAIRDGPDCGGWIAERWECSVPVLQGGRVIAYLHTTGRASARFARRTGSARIRVNQAAPYLNEADSLPRDRRGPGPRGGQASRAALNLLGIFSQHLGLLANGLLLQRARGDPPPIAQAREYIHAHQSEPLSFRTVARAVHMSPFYFCKQFRKNTGLNFTQYVWRCRVETAQRLLLNPQSRVSEIAIEVGFQSIPHFNRVFKGLVGQSPSQYRAGRLRAGDKRVV